MTCRIMYPQEGEEGGIYSHTRVDTRTGPEVALPGRGLSPSELVLTGLLSII